MYVRTYYTYVFVHLAKGTAKQITEFYFRLKSKHLHPKIAEQFEQPYTHR